MIRAILTSQEVAGGVGERDRSATVSRNVRRSPTAGRIIISHNYVICLLRLLLLLAVVVVR